MRILFLADTHLRHPDDPSYSRLLRFLKTQQGELDHLVLLGDILDFWIGYRHVCFRQYVPFLEQIRQLKNAGTRISYCEGNHDFRLGIQWQELTEGRVYPDGAMVQLAGQQIYLAHGDLMDENNRSYRLLRSFLRSPVIGGLQSILPPDWVWEFGQWCSRKSRKSHGMRQPNDFLEKLLESHAAALFARGAQAVVTAHHHVPLLLETERGVIVSVGDWVSRSSYALLEDGRFSLHTFD